ncbi:MAG: Rieske 2Fe-2S domain-containing protein [Anaerolineae bacterium]|nr:Rieske 2Fe-2S domain-containing protein [Anaerolineae bacterium]
METRSLSQEEKVQRGAIDSGRFFRQAMDFIGFTEEDSQAIRQSSLVIEKHIPNIVADFYENLLRYPFTRKHFLKKDGSIDQDYLQKRMQHLSNFWRRTAGGEYDDEFARYVDYVGRAHTSHGADPNIYIEERYVIGQVGFMQHAINNSLHKELHEYNPELEAKAIRAWNLLMMVILEMLARAYNDEPMEDQDELLLVVKREPVQQLAVDAYEKGLGLIRPPQYREIQVASIEEIPNGKRKIIQVDNLSIGVFHHNEEWFAVRNHCVHRGGPVATGPLKSDTLICPLHGYQYNLKTGQLLVDPTSKLETYKVTVKDQKVYVTIPQAEEEQQIDSFFDKTSSSPKAESAPRLQPNQFLASKIPSGKIGLVEVKGAEVAVYNLEGQFFATSNLCTHEEGPLSKGEVRGETVICPWHGSCFNVKTGKVECGPAAQSLKTFAVMVSGDIGSVESS